MKIICLHGTFCSAEIFKTQLNPLISTLEKRGVVDFKWIDGFHETPAPPTYQDYYGAPPHYRWFNWGSEDIKNGPVKDDPVVKFRAIAPSFSPEDTMRTCFGERKQPYAKHVQPSLDRLFQLLEEDPEIEGLFSYSEGGILAATAILEEQRRRGGEGRPCQIKHAVFFAGWPPLYARDDLIARPVLADEREDMIEVPTCHIIGFY
ncbi:hypothetical protein N7501_003317 [Penicillium viridicatum]|nr:hypothetical protein N7501_003317 [Penicillium viridicatum]